MKNKVLIFDGNSILLRIVYGYSKGKDGVRSLDCNKICINAFIDTVKKACYNLAADQAFVVWDSGSRSSRRTAILPDYKKTPSRESKTEEEIKSLKEGIRILTGYLRKLNVRVISVPGREADDVIYQISKNFNDVVIVSSDSDFYQLISKNISVYKNYEDKLITINTVEEEIGIHPSKYVLAKAIIGDSSDNIYGIFGIGKTTAYKILNEHSEVFNLESLLAELDKIDTKKRSKKLESITEFKDIIERNISLIDLAQEEFSDNELSMLDMAIERKVVIDYSVGKELQIFGFKDWVGTFERLS